MEVELVEVELVVVVRWVLAAKEDLSDFQVQMEDKDLQDYAVRKV